MDVCSEENFDDFVGMKECTVALFEVTHSDCQAVEHFADAVLRDDFFFRKGHWLSLLSDSRVQLFVVRIQQQGQTTWSEILGVVVLYADSVLHNIFLARWCRGFGMGAAVINALAPEKIRAKADMSTGDPTNFYHRLGFTHEAERSGKRGQIRVLTKLPTSTRASNLKRKKKDDQEPSVVPPRDS